MEPSTWNRERPAVAVAIAFPPLVKASPMHDRIEAVRDTLLVFGLQVVFRITQLLRHWNY